MQLIAEAAAACCTAASASIFEGEQMTERTIVHLLRHGEVAQPGQRVLYGRLPDFHCPSPAARWPSGGAGGDRRDVVLVVAVAAGRAQETPCRLLRHSARGATDPRVIAGQATCSRA